MTSRARAWSLALAVAALALLHVILVSWFAPLGALISDLPFVEASGIARQVERGSEALRVTGALHAWDPRVYAGSVVGVVDDPTTAGVAIVAVALGGARALGVIVLVMHLSVPLCGWMAARLFGLSSWRSLACAALWVLLWFFDGALHSLWFTGALGWTLGALIAPVAVGLVYRATLGSSLFASAAFVAAMSALAVASRDAAFLALPACFLSAFLCRRSLSFAVPVAGTLAAGAAFALIHSRAVHVDGATGAGSLAPTLDYAFFDSLDLLVDPMHTGAPVRTAVRTLAIVLAALGCRKMLGDGDSRGKVMLAHVAIALFFAYASGHVPGLRERQPYGHVAVAMLGASIPAASYLGDLVLRVRAEPWDRSARVLVGLAAVAVVPRVVGTVLQYLPELLPEPVRYWKVALNSSALVGLDEPAPYAMRHLPPPREHAAVRAWLIENPPRGRVLVKDPVLADRLIATTSFAVIGGLRERVPVAVRGAQIFHAEPGGFLRGEALGQYLERYAIDLAIVSGKPLPVDYRTDAFERVREVAGFRVYRAVRRPSYTERGEAAIVSQSLALLRVEDARGSELVLRFHHAPGLVCRPSCTAESTPDGFIRVPSPPPSFEIGP